MFENGDPVGRGHGRGRGRGRGRGSHRVSKNPFPDNTSAFGRGIWVRGDKLSQLSEDKLPAEGRRNATNREVKKEYNPSFLANSSPSLTNPFQGSCSSTLPPKISSSNFKQNSVGTSSTVCSTIKSSPPKPLLSLQFSSPLPRKPFTTTHARTRLENSNWQKRSPPIHPQEVTYHNQMRFMDSSRSGRCSFPQQNSRVSGNDNFKQGQPQRINKRPVNSPTNATSDSSLQQKFSPMEYPQHKKKKKKRKTEADATTKENKTKDLVNPELCELQVSENKNFTEQTHELISQLEQTECERKMRLEILKDVKETVAPYLPFVEPQIYGSTLTNIAFKSSDLDIFLYCPNGQPEYNFVLEKGWLMYKSPKFKNVVRVSRARVPVIKATHRATNVDLDISTMSGQAVNNSMLIKHILSMDVRFRPLAMLISLWCKLNVITGHSRFTSYSIVLMLLYYLQKVNPPLLPPLKDILYTNNENEWPNFFTEKLLTNENSSDIAQLFKGFFVFYANFNYEGLIISPYLSKEIPVSYFQNIDELPEDFKIYKNKLTDNTTPFMVTNVIHVQDPMEHNVNTTKGVFPRLLKLFRRSIDRFLNSCTDNVPQNHWLPTIIKQLPLKLVDEKKFEFTLNYPKNEEGWFENLKQDFRQLLKILLIRITEEELENKTDKNIGLHKDSFYAEANYNVFNRKFRYPLRMYMSDAIDLVGLQKQFEIVIERIKSETVLFKTKFNIEQENNIGPVKVTIIDKNTTGLNSFQSMVPEFKRYYGRFLEDIVTNRKSAATLLNDSEKIIADCDIGAKKVNAKNYLESNEENELSEENEEDVENGMGFTEPNLEKDETQ